MKNKVKSLTKTIISFAVCLTITGTSLPAFYADETEEASPVADTAEEDAAIPAEDATPEADDPAAQEVTATFYAYPNKLESDAWVGDRGSERTRLGSAERQTKKTFPAGTTIGQAGLWVIFGGRDVEFTGWSLTKDGDKLPDDTVIQDGVEYYPTYREYPTKITADAGEEGYFERDGKQVRELNLVGDDFDFTNLTYVDIPKPSVDGRNNVEIPLPTPKEGYKLVGFTYHISCWRDKTGVYDGYMDRFDVECLFSHPKYNNRKFYGLLRDWSLHVTYIYEKLPVETSIPTDFPTADTLPTADFKPELPVEETQTSIPTDFPTADTLPTADFKPELPVEETQTSIPTDFPTADTKPVGSVISETTTTTTTTSSTTTKPSSSTQKSKKTLAKTGENPAPAAILIVLSLTAIAAMIIRHKKSKQ